MRGLGGEQHVKCSRAGFPDGVGRLGHRPGNDESLRLYGPADEAEAIRTIRRALGVAMTPLDTADFYGAQQSDVPVQK